MHTNPIELTLNGEKLILTERQRTALYKAFKHEYGAVIAHSAVLKNLEAKKLIRWAPGQTVGTILTAGIEAVKRISDKMGYK